MLIVEINTELFELISCMKQDYCGLHYQNRLNENGEKFYQQLQTAINNYLPNSQVINSELVRLIVPIRNNFCGLYYQNRLNENGKSTYQRILNIINILNIQ